MSKFFENKRNQIILGITIGIILVGAIVLILTGKIDLRSIMGNTAQGKYTCPSGYTLSGTKCTRTVTVGNASYICPSGYKNHPTDSNKCVKQIDRECPSGSQSGTGGACYATDYSCPSGGRISGSNCIKAAETTYVCPSGYIQGGSSGSTCYKAASLEYTCPSGFKFSGDPKTGGTCINMSKPKEKVQEYLCEEKAGERKEGNNCIITKPATGYTACPSGYSNFGSSQCKKTTYSCPNGGSLSGTTCTKQKGYNTSCPSGYTASGPTSCTRTAEKKETTINRQKTYACPSGYNSYGSSECIRQGTKYGDTKWCEDWRDKLVGNNCVRDAQKDYVCPTGTTKEGSSCTTSKIPKPTCPAGWNNYGSSECIKPATKGNGVGKVCNGTEISGVCYAVANKFYYCSTGTASGSTCIKTEMIDATLVKTEKVEGTITQCNTGLGYELVNGECVKVEPVQPPARPSTDNIPDGTVPSKPTDDKKDETTTPPSDDKKDETTTPPTDDKKDETTPPPTDDKKDETTTPPTDDKKDETTTPIVKTCPAGYTQSGEICTKTETVNATVKYSCANGYTLKGSKCQKVDSKEPTSTFTCPTGYAKSGNSCYRIDKKNATVTYTCETGYTLNKSTRKCEKVSTINVTTGGYTCPEGYDPVEGTKECVKVSKVENLPSCPYIYIDGECIKVDYQNASTMNSCPTGYTLNGGVCEGKTTVDAISNYKCASGYTLNGKTCTRRINKTVDTKKYCPTGYKLSNNKCQKTIEVAAKATYTCNSGYTLNGKVCTRTLTAELK